MAASKNGHSDTADLLSQNGRNIDAEDKVLS